MAHITEDVCSMVLKQNALRVFRKAINVMKDVAVFITFQTIGTKTLRLSVLDHFACGGMYVDIEVQEHGMPGMWINLVSEHLFKLSSALSKSRHDIAVVIHDHQFALFLHAETHKSILPTTSFQNFTSLTNQFHGIDENNYYCFEFVSKDLLNTLTCLSIGTVNVHTMFWNSGKLRFSNTHDMGNTIITKQLFGEVVVNSAREEEVLLLDEIYVITFAKLLVNLLVNSSQKFCFLLLPKKNTQPLVIKFFISNDTFQYYLIFPFVPVLQHNNGDSSTQASIKMNT